MVNGTGLVVELFGMPLMIPVDENSVSPAGSAPLVIAQVAGEVPPDISKVALYGTLTMPAGSAVVAMLGGPLMTTVNGCGLEVKPPESLALTVKLYPPVVVGVPLITPVEAFKVKPGGKLAKATVQPP